MNTHCKKLISYLEEEIQYNGLKQISGTIFSKHPIRRVLEAKQFEHRLYTSDPADMFKARGGKFVSKALIAKDLLGMMTGETILIIGECMICSKFLLEGNDENHVCPEDKVKEYNDREKLFQDIINK